MWTTIPDYEVAYALRSIVAKLVELGYVKETIEDKGWFEHHHLVHDTEPLRDVKWPDFWAIMQPYVDSNIDTDAKKSLELLREPRRSSLWMRFYADMLQTGGPTNVIDFGGLKTVRELVEPDGPTIDLALCDAKRPQIQAEVSDLRLLRLKCLLLKVGLSEDKQMTLEIYAYQASRSTVVGLQTRHVPQSSIDEPEGRSRDAQDSAQSRLPRWIPQLPELAG